MSFFSVLRSWNKTTGKLLYKFYEKYKESLTDRKWTWTQVSRTNKFKQITFKIFYRRPRNGITIGYYSRDEMWNDQQEQITLLQKNFRCLFLRNHGDSTYFQVQSSSPCFPIRLQHENMQKNWKPALKVLSATVEITKNCFRITHRKKRSFLPSWLLNNPILSDHLRRFLLM